MAKRKKEEVVSRGISLVEKLAFHSVLNLPSSPQRAFACLVHALEVQYITECVEKLDDGVRGKSSSSEGTHRRRLHTGHPGQQLEQLPAPPESKEQRQGKCRCAGSPRGRSQGLASSLAHLCLDPFFACPSAKLPLSLDLEESEFDEAAHDVHLRSSSSLRDIDTIAGIRLDSQRFVGMREDKAQLEEDDKATLLTVVCAAQVKSPGGGELEQCIGMSAHHPVRGDVLTGHTVRSFRYASYKTSLLGYGAVPRPSCLRVWTQSRFREWTYFIFYPDEGYYLSSSAAESALALWYLGIRNQEYAGCHFSHSGLEKHKYQEASETVKVITNCETCLPEDLGKVTEGKREGNGECFSVFIKLFRAQEPEVTMGTSTDTMHSPVDRARSSWSQSVLDRKEQQLQLFIKGHVYKYHMEMDNIKSGNSAMTGLSAARDGYVKDGIASRVVGILCESESGKHAEEAHATAECQLVRIQLCICSQETDFEPSNCGCDSSNRDCYDASRPLLTGESLVTIASSVSSFFVRAEKEERGLLNHSLPQQIRRHFDIVLVASGIIMKKTSNTMTSVPLKPLKSIPTHEHPLCTLDTIAGILAVTEEDGTGRETFSLLKADAALYQGQLIDVSMDRHRRGADMGNETQPTNGHATAALVSNDPQMEHDSVRIIAFIVKIPLASLHYSYLKEMYKPDCQINVPSGHIELKLLITYSPASHRAVAIITIVFQAACRDTGVTAWIMAHHLHCFASLITITKGFTEELNSESEDYNFSLNITM
ncbi:hypothetical protein U0070_009582, partial [Myodes glareolus]